jgi:signal transduction histidine kinase/CheY-like chemotaxis protein
MLQTFVVTIITMVLPMAAVVNEWRRAEAQRAALLAREQAARLDAEAASSAKDGFLAMLGHELRNPLAAIMAAAHVLNRVASREAAHGQAQDVITRQIRHLGNLVDDLLDVTRVKTGKITLERSSVDLAALVSRIVEALRLEAAGPVIHIDTGSGAPVWVNGDSTRLEQVVTNLLTNALKYTPAVGTIHISVRREEGQAALRVRDTGIGIDAALLPKIFDQFIQADSGPARSEGGLGLGLTLVKHLVELHGGRVTAASDGPGRGSLFTVWLPIMLPEASPRRATATPPLGARRRVLLVEDQADARTMMKISLELSGHEVFEAQDGPAGVEAVQQHAPDVAFVDLGLPGFDGYEVARQVRSARGHGVVLIALTGYGQPEDRERAEAAGFDLHLVKPVDPAQLSDLIAGFPAGSGFSRTAG